MRSAGGDRGRGRDVTPDDQQPNTTPLEPTGQHSFLLQGMMDLQRAFGRVEHAIGALETKVSEQSASIRLLQRTIWVTTGVVVAIVAVLGWFVDHNYERIARWMQPAPPAAAASPARPAP